MKTILAAAALGFVVTAALPAVAADIVTAPTCVGFANSGPHTDASGATVPGTRCVVSHETTPKKG